MTRNFCSQHWLRDAERDTERFKCACFPPHSQSNAPSKGHVGGGEWIDFLHTPSWVKSLRSLASNESFQSDLQEAGRRSMMHIAMVLGARFTTTYPNRHPMVTRDEKRALRGAIDAIWNDVRPVLFEYRICDEITELDTSRIMKDLMGRLVSYLILRELGTDEQVRNTAETTVAKKVTQALSRYILPLFGPRTLQTMTIAGVELTLQEIVEIVHYKSIIDKHVPLVNTVPTSQQGGSNEAEALFASFFATVFTVSCTMIVVLSLLFVSAMSSADRRSSERRMVRERRMVEITAMQQSFNAAYERATRSGTYWKNRLKTWQTRLNTIAQNEPQIADRLYAKRDDITSHSENPECVVCMHAERTVLLSKCRHLVLCDTCVLKLLDNDSITCPICRQKQNRQSAMPLLEYLYETNASSAEIIMSGGFGQERHSRASCSPA